MSNYLTVEEVAKELKVCTHTIRKAIQKGRIQAFRAGIGTRSPFRIHRSELDRIQIMDFEETIKNIKGE